MKILIHSNHPEVGTGYGQQTALLARLLKQDNHDVAVSAFYGQSGWICRWNDINIYPGGYHLYGNDVILQNAASHFGGDLKDGLIITLIDVWVLNAADLKRANVACWTPVDHDPTPPAVLGFLEASGVWPIAMSGFGRQQLQNASLSPLYVPHGINTDIFSPRDRAEARKTLGIPQDAFLIGMVAANKGYPPRKGFPEALRAFARFREKHAEAVMYLHTEPTGVHQGVNIAQLVTQLGLPPASVVVTDPYRYLLGLPQDFVANVYSAMDVMLNPAYGEGFGIPIVEAQACGTPVIATGWTSMPELVAEGWVAGGKRMWSTQGSWWLVPDVDELVSLLEVAYTMGGRRRRAAREFALRYDYRRVFEEYWRPVLAELGRRMAPLSLPAPVLV